MRESQCCALVWGMGIGFRLLPWIERRRPSFLFECQCLHVCFTRMKERMHGEILAQHHALSQGNKFLYIGPTNQTPFSFCSLVCTTFHPPNDRVIESINQWIKDLHYGVFAKPSSDRRHALQPVVHGNRTWGILTRRAISSAPPVPSLKASRTSSALGS